MTLRHENTQTYIAPFLNRSLLPVIDPFKRICFCSASCRYLKGSLFGDSEYLVTCSNSRHWTACVCLCMCDSWPVRHVCVCVCVCVSGVRGSCLAMMNQNVSRRVTRNKWSPTSLSRWHQTDCEPSAWRSRTTYPVSGDQSLNDQSLSGQSLVQSRLHCVRCST